jgi:hypothetical protein
MKLNLLISSMVALGLFTSPVAMSATTLDAAQKKQVETIVHDYLISNPDVVVQSLQSYQQKQMAETQKSFEKIQQTAPNLQINSSIKQMILLQGTRTAPSLSSNFLTTNALIVST